MHKKKYSVLKNCLLAFSVMLSITGNAFCQNWQPIGPFNRTNGGESQGSGRINTIAFHSLYGNYDPYLSATNRTIFAGSPFGGIWISRDDGANWSNSDPLGQFTNFTTDFLPGCGVADIVVDNTSSTTLFAAINYATTVNLIGRQGVQTVGVYKYTPGTGWVATNLTYPYFSKKEIMQLTIDPNNNNVLFASTSDGIYRTADGGTTWSLVRTDGNDLPYRNVVYDPTTAGTVYACGREIWMSTTNGVSGSWTQISNFQSLITGNTGIILCDAAVKSSSAIYAGVVYKNSSGAVHYYFTSYNGSTWANNLPMFPVCATNPSWSDDYLSIIVHTNGANDYVYACQEQMERYSVTANSWNSNNHISGYNSDMHCDIHEIVFAPDNSALWIGNDGGIYKATSNLYSGTPNWTHMNTGLNVATVYTFAGAQTDPDLYLVGEVDNGNTYTGNADENNFNSISWQAFQAADGAEKLIDRTNSTNWMSRTEEYPEVVNCFNGTHSSKIQHNTSGNPNSASWTSIYTDPNISPNACYAEDWAQYKPLVQDYNNPNVVYRGINGILRSSDFGASAQNIFPVSSASCFSSITDWGSYAVSIAPAPSNSNYLYSVISNVYNSAKVDRVFQCNNALNCPYTLSQGGCSDPNTTNCSCDYWFDITPPWPNISTALINQTRITSVVVSDKNVNNVWVGYTYTSYTPTYKVYMWDGTTWTDWGNGLPDVDVNCLAYENGSNDGIYAGTDIGVYYRNKSMSGWILFSTNLPAVKVNRLEINYHENTIRAGTFGRGIWKSALYCPTSTLTVTGCSNCIAANTVTEAGTLFVKNSTINQSTEYFRATDYIEITPDVFSTYTLFAPDATNTTSVYAYIHGCSETSPDNTFRMQYPSATVVETEEQDQLEIFPNPNDGIFTLRAGEPVANSLVELFDVTGKSVYKKQFAVLQNEQIDITSLSPGIYYVRIINDKGFNETHKIVKQ